MDLDLDSYIDKGDCSKALSHKPQSSRGFKKEYKTVSLKENEKSINELIEILCED